MALDKRLENLDQTIELQEQSLEIAKAKKEAGRGTELAVQRFQAEVRKNQSEKLIVKQEIIEVENRINFLVNRFPQPVERMSAGFFDLNIAHAERGSARAAASEPTRHPPGRARAGGCRARREGRPGPLLSQAGHHRRRWLPGLQPKVSVHDSGSLDLQCRRQPGRAVDQQESDPGRIPQRERQAIAEPSTTTSASSSTPSPRSSTACPRWRTTARASRSRSSSWNRSRPRSTAASKLFQNARVEYIDVLFAQRDLMDARMVLIETKRQQLSAIVNAYQALGGGGYLFPIPIPKPLQSHHRWNALETLRSERGGGKGSCTASAPPGGKGSATASNTAFGRGLVPPPTPPAERGPGPLPTPAAETDPEPLPITGGGKGAGPLPTPAAERDPEPLPD